MVQACLPLCCEPPSSVWEPSEPAWPKFSSSSPGESRAGTELDAVEDVLCRARDRGIEHIENIAHREALLLGIDKRTAIDYLTKNLYYRLGSAERGGLRLFYELAVNRGLTPGGVDLVFRDYASAG